MTDLFTAITSSEVEECVARGDKLEAVRKIDFVEQTPLIHSIRRGNKAVFLSLLQHGANPNYKSRWTLRPIQWAASEGWKDMVEALVKAGADVNEKGGRGCPLHYAARNGSVDVTEGLL